MDEWKLRECPARMWTLSLHAAALLLGLASAPACDVSPSDIVLQAKPDAGDPAPSLPKDTGHDAGFDARVNGSQDEGLLDDTTDGRDKGDDSNPASDEQASGDGDDHYPGLDDPMDASMDAMLDSTTEGPDADADADVDRPIEEGPPPSEDDAGDELDAGIDPDAGEAGIDDRPEACRNGTFECVPYRFLVLLDYLANAPSPTVRAEVSGYVFESTGEAGLVEGWLPANVAYDMRVSEHGYWPLVFRMNPEASNIDFISSFSLWSTSLIAYYFGSVGLLPDVSKALVIATIAPTIPGLGLTLSQSSDPSVVATPQWVTSISDRLLEDSGPLVSFVNVEPGTFYVTPIVPEGYECNTYPELEATYVAEPGTATAVSLLCHATEP